MRFFRPNKNRNTHNILEQQKYEFSFYAASPYRSVRSFLFTRFLETLAYTPIAQVHQHHRRAPPPGMCAAPHISIVFKQFEAAWPRVLRIRIVTNILSQLGHLV